MKDCIDPNKKKGWFFPNWFNKDHFEVFLGEKISDKEFEAWKEYLMDETNIFDAISNEVQGFVMLFKDEFKNWLKEKEAKK